VTRGAGGTNGKLSLARCVPLRGSSEKMDRPARARRPAAGQHTLRGVWESASGERARTHPSISCSSTGGRGPGLRLRGYSARDDKRD
jgi:hypothetical protein